MPVIKRSVSIAGHQTSVSLEPLFWAQLKLLAKDNGAPVNQYIADIEEQLTDTGETNLSSALRVHVLMQALTRQHTADQH
tara:strand:+ start:661 stop:900 length:240 start_codon:yes stop_codon:yes gene_type:complete